MARASASGRHASIARPSAVQNTGTRRPANVVLAADLGPRGIRVNVVAPDFIETDLTRECIQTNAWYHGIMCNATALALPPSCVPTITVQVLAVDGGWLGARYRA